jgi:hypothetical protein
MISSSVSLWGMIVSLLLLCTHWVSAFRVPIKCRVITPSLYLVSPRVPFANPSYGLEWLDIGSRLNRERILFLGSEIDEENANLLIGNLLVCGGSI